MPGRREAATVLDETRTAPWFAPIVAIGRRRKWLALTVFAVPFTVILGVVISLPNSYESRAVVIVERQQVPEAFVRSTVTSQLETLLPSISLEVLSRSRLDELISRFGLYPDLKNMVSREALIRRMRRDITLEPSGVVARGRSGDTIGFSIAYRGRDPQTVALVANTLAGYYVEENLRARERQAAGTADFLKTQLDATKQRLDDQERRVSEFKKRHIGELPEQMSANLATLERLNMSLHLNGVNLTRALERRETLSRQRAETAALEPVSGPEAAAVRLARLKQDLIGLLTKFTDKHPSVVRLKEEIIALEDDLGRSASQGSGTEAEPGVASPQLLQIIQESRALAAEIKALQNEAGHLRSDLALYQTRVENTPRREQEFQDLARDYETTKALYASLLNRHEEAQLAENMEQRQKGEQFRILDPAIPPEEPAAPRRRRLLLMGGVLSLALAAGAAMLAEQLDTSFHTVDELRGFSRVPVLVSIPLLLSEAAARRGRRRLWLAVCTTTLGVMCVFVIACWVTREHERLLWIISRGA
jgi:polysaccharide chain length determinant protein (PEP-CTERM system associated)